MILWSFFRIFRKKTENRHLYIFGLIAIFMGFAFDFLATMRNIHIMYNYGIYSISFYVIGLVMVFAA